MDVAYFLMILMSGAFTIRQGGRAGKAGVHQPNSWAKANTQTSLCGHRPDKDASQAHSSPPGDKGGKFLKFCEFSAKSRMVLKQAQVVATRHEMKE